jgi:DNA-directed RNA polymerase subunit RPC12/RpoP
MDIPVESKVKIKIHCPQCGGDIAFLEEAHVIRCEFCGQSLLVAGREGVLRYVFPALIQDSEAAQTQALEHLKSLRKRSPRPLKAFLFYAPFWRMQGSVYRWVFGLKPMKVEVNAGVPPPMERTKVFLTRLLDHTIPGNMDLDLGISNLGVRSQTFILQVFDREHLEKRESFLPLETPLEQVQAEAERFSNLFFEAEDLIAEVNLQGFVGRNFSVIYFPIWYVECQHMEGGEVLLLDAVGKKILRVTPDGSFILDKLKGGESRKSFAFQDLRFLPFRCPNCGWSFPFRPFNLLHFCDTCRRLWGEKNGDWAEFPYQTISPAPAAASKEFLWIPFWRCRALIDSGGERLETMADLYRLAPPPRVVNREKESRRPIFFFIPAIKFRNPQLLHTLASRLTFSQPELTTGPFPDGSHPCAAGGSLPAADAREMGAVILGSMIPQGNRQARTWLKGCQVELKEPQLLYFPFTQVDLFLKELSTGLSFQRNALLE